MIRKLKVRIVILVVLGLTLSSIGLVVAIHYINMQIFNACFGKGVEQGGQGSVVRAHHRGSNLLGHFGIHPLFEFIFDCITGASYRTRRHRR